MIGGLLVIAGALLMAETAATPPTKPEYNPKLEPIAWTIGKWEAQTTTGTGDVRETITDTWSWIIDKQAILLDVQWTKADGTPNGSGHVVFYWDSAEQKIAFHGTFSAGISEAGRLIKADETGLTWEDRIVLGSGNQGHFVLKNLHAPGSDSYTRGWSKVSGSGSDEMGPYRFKRVK